MKRVAVSVVLLVSAFACTTSVEEEPVAAPPALASTPTPITIAASEPVSGPAPAPVDDTKDLIPTGAFYDTRSFCTAQMVLAAPRIAKANQDSRSDGSDELSSTPSCKETPDALKHAKIDASLTVTAVTVEAGHSEETFLLVRDDAGWTAVRTPLLASYHRDPGCPSIERPTAITKIGVNAGALVVTTTAGRMWWNDQEGGELYLTYARTCHAGVACAKPEVVDAKVVLDDANERDAPTRTRVFTTTYTVANDGAIVPAEGFDEATL